MTAMKPRISKVFCHILVGAGIVATTFVVVPTSVRAQEQPQEQRADRKPLAAVGLVLGALCLIFAALQIAFEIIPPLGNPGR